MRFAGTSGVEPATETDAEIATDATDGVEPDAHGVIAEDIASNQERTDNAGVELAA